MGTMTKEQIEAVAERWQKDVRELARKWADEGARIDIAYEGMFPTFRDYLEAAAQKLIGGRYEWQIAERIDGGADFWITRYLGRPTDDGN